MFKHASRVLLLAAAAVFNNIGAQTALAQTSSLTTLVTDQTDLGRRLAKMASPGIAGALSYSRHPIAVRGQSYQIITNEGMPQALVQGDAPLKFGSFPIEVWNLDTKINDLKNFDRLEQAYVTIQAQMRELSITLPADNAGAEALKLLKQTEESIRARKSTKAFAINPGITGKFIRQIAEGIPGYATKMKAIEHIPDDRAYQAENLLIEYVRSKKGTEAMMPIVQSWRNFAGTAFNQQQSFNRFDDLRKEIEREAQALNDGSRISSAPHFDAQGRETDYMPPPALSTNTIVNNSHSQFAPTNKGSKPKP